MYCVFLSKQELQFPKVPSLLVGPNRRVGRQKGGGAQLRGGRALLGCCTSMLCGLPLREGAAARPAHPGVHAAPWRVHQHVTRDSEVGCLAGEEDQHESQTSLLHSGWSFFCVLVSPVLLSLIIPN